jgi:phosphodiesterase/alkaline phosphatase D-like protein
VTSSSATLSGTVNPGGAPISYAFQYGTSTSYGQQTSSQSAGSGTSDENVTATLNGLPSGTKIHYRIIATYASNSTVVGNDATFNTTGQPPVVHPPDATTGNATNVTANGAQLHGTVGASPSGATYYFQYGLNAYYGMQSGGADLSVSSSARSVNATLSGLQSNVTYHYRLVTRSSNGLLSVGADGTFATSSQGRLRSRGLTIHASSTLGRRQIIVYASGTLQLPGAVSAQRACFGTVWVQIKAGARTLAYTPLPLSRSCQYHESRSYAYSALHHSNRLRVAARFAGNGTLQPVWSFATHVRA